MFIGLTRKSHQQWKRRQRSDLNRPQGLLWQYPPAPGQTNHTHAREPSPRSLSRKARHLIDESFGVGSFRLYTLAELVLCMFHMEYIGMEE